jgi:ring-1,2-phenylacetyl-CoA epoxidase subunit PaaD
VRLVVRLAVEEVNDPELSGVTVGSLGMVKSVAVADDGTAHIVIVPTFLGCPALAHIAFDVERAAISAGASAATVVFDHEDPWSTDRIDSVARNRLAELGIAVPSVTGTACPFCGAATLDQISPVGPASCRSAHWCGSCRNVVEVFRDVRASLASLPIPTRRMSYAHL